MVLSLETSLVNVTLGVYRTSATYTCSVYATTEDGDGSPTDGIAVTTGGNLRAVLCKKESIHVHVHCNADYSNASIYTV